jgi:ribonuclease HIII
LKPNHAIPPSLDKLLQRENIRVTGNREIPNATQYDLARSNDTAKLNVYHTGKVSTGGKASRLREVLEGWRTSSGRGKVGSSKATTKPEARQSGPLLEGTPRLGIDEAGKGDYFGPIVCAGVRISGIEAAQNLKKIGVRDSKDLSLAQVRRMAERIPEAIGDGNVHIVSLTPREYEERRSAAGNVNKLLGEVDAGIIRKLAVEVEVVVVDQFAPAARSYVASSVPKGVRLEVRTRAEDDAAVAAASIVARARQLDEMDRLSEGVGFKLPLGATHVVGAGMRVCAEGGMERLRDLAKVSFRTTERVTKNGG